MFWLCIGAALAHYLGLGWTSTPNCVLTLGTLTHLINKTELLHFFYESGIYTYVSRLV